MPFVMKNPENAAVPQAPEPRDPWETAIFAAELGHAPQIDLHGMPSHEALGELERFLNHEFLAGTEVVKIIHGRGRGILRQAIRKALKEHELVARFRDADNPAQKGGVTYAALHSKGRPSEPRPR
jgi:dsDNA-specific endonuclease/ATPase MutS2